MSKVYSRSRALWDGLTIPFLPADKGEQEEKGDAPRHWRTVLADGRVRRAWIVDSLFEENEEDFSLSPPPLSQNMTCPEMPCLG